MIKKTENLKLTDTFEEFKENKNIDRATLISVLEESFRNVIAKLYGTDENYNIIVNPEKGELEIYRNRTVVNDNQLNDPDKQITVTEARKIEPDYEPGEEVSEKINPTTFGRRAILTLRQTLAGKILELEHDMLYNKYKDKVGEIVSVEVYQIWKKEILCMDDDNNELILPKQEQIPADFFHKGDNIRAVVTAVDNNNNNTKILISRTSPLFLQRLLEAEIPEIRDGLITIRKVARIPGERAKVAVESYDDRIDPVGACVGVKGNRVKGIVRELHGENIDVVNYSQNTQLLIARALSPANINSININEQQHTAEVYLNPDQVALAIGKNGYNIRLASMLTEYTIDVFREVETAKEGDDVYLDEFKGDIDPWIIDTLKNIGLETAKDVLNAPRETLLTQADLEEETVDEILKILADEFRDEQ